ncbi:hypothetical protein CRV09_01450 [Candidatus Pantoea edessiphila]|uniref:DUF883 domain-containing protein n=1 Tax=Candidatus Pantoea edessiphila TaxID=2044610 RepID=A0A2P5T2Z0_9GAMM|nr:DUF883 family protein [Candidatus Pantoea edessiphila]PPI88948.1 hypothetical protein CRV09_01450 [Candidatus Pantoea edessiphila]
MSNQIEKYNNININKNMKELTNSLKNLLKSYGSESKDNVVNARNHAEVIIKKTRNKIINNDNDFYTKNNLVNQIDNYLHEKPWHGVSMGATAGIILSMLLFSKR